VEAVHDGELLTRYLQGDREEAFRTLAERHGPMVLAVCRRLAPGSAEDAVQAVFLALARKAAGLRGQRDVGPWLYRAAVFAARSALRKSGRRRKAEDAAMQERREARVPSPEAEAAHREMAGHLDAAIMSLSPRCREAVVLCHLEGLSQTQAAGRLGVPAGTVADRCARGLAKLRARLSRRGVTLSAAGLTAALGAVSAETSTGFASAGLVPSIVGAVCGSPGASAGVMSIAQGTMGAMTFAKVKLVTVVAGAVLLAGAAVTSAGVLMTRGQPGRAWGSGFSESVVWKRGHRDPAVVLSNEGALLAFSDRRPQMSASTGDSLVMKRSTDGGRTWSRANILQEGVIGVPCPLVDRSGGVVRLFFWKKRGLMMITSSRDGGLSWDAPEKLEAEVRGIGPGHGIQLSTGRLLAPARGEKSFCLYSDDGGTSWKRGGNLRRYAMMFSMVELADGSVYANGRRPPGTKGFVHRRLAARSTDGGLTWGKLEEVPALPDSDCQMSLVRLTGGHAGGRSRVLFCGPAGPKRRNLTAYISYDECRSWKRCKLIARGAAGYSDLVVLPDMSIGCIYEAHRPGLQSIRFARFTLEWLTDGKDKIKPRKGNGSTSK
jgi:RNA polymerase sigma factor (sigma-70 family)